MTSIKNKEILDFDPSIGGIDSSNDDKIDDHSLADTEEIWFPNFKSLRNKLVTNRLTMEATMSDSRTKELEQRNVIATLSRRLNLAEIRADAATEIANRFHELEYQLRLAVENQRKLVESNTSMAVDLDGLSRLLNALPTDRICLTAVPSKSNGHDRITVIDIGAYSQLTSEQFNWLTGNDINKLSRADRAKVQLHKAVKQIVDIVYNCENGKAKVYAQDGDWKLAKVCDSNLYYLTNTDSKSRPCYNVDAITQTDHQSTLDTDHPELNRGAVNGVTAKDSLTPGQTPSTQSKWFSNTYTSRLLTAGRNQVPSCRRSQSADTSKSMVAFKVNASMPKSQLDPSLIDHNMCPPFLGNSSDHIVGSDRGANNVLKGENQHQFRHPTSLPSRVDCAKCNGQNGHRIATDCDRLRKILDLGAQLVETRRQRDKLAEQCQLQEKRIMDLEEDGKVSKNGQVLSAESSQPLSMSGSRDGEIGNEMDSRLANAQAKIESLERINNQLESQNKIMRQDLAKLLANRKKKAYVAELNRSFEWKANAELNLKKERVII